MELNLRPYCPVNGWDCPYWCYDGTCKLENPAEECDDFAAMEECLEDDDPDHVYIFGEKPPLSDGEIEFEPGRIYWDEMAANP